MLSDKTVYLEPGSTINESNVVGIQVRTGVGAIEYRLGSDFAVGESGVLLKAGETDSFRASTVYMRVNHGGPQNIVLIKDE